MGLFQSRIVRPKELAEYLGVTTVTLWRWERNGQLPVKRRFSAQVMGWLESELEEWFASTAGGSQDGKKA